ncbi:MAG: FtsX-like permease family protein, partial [Planctomycetota bacterium]
GWLWVQILAWIRPAMYPGGVTPGLVGPLAAILAAVAAALLAGLLPARAASRHRPIEAMSCVGARARGRGRPLATGLGLILLVAHLVLATAAPAADRQTANILTGAALIAIVCAALLLVPALIVCVERLFATPAARCLRLPPALLRQQLSGRLGRSAGTVLTLAVCLGLSVTLNVWGRTMVTPFLPSPELPDTVVSVMPAGLPPEAAEAVRELPGVDSDRVLPMAVEQTALGGHLLAASGGDISQAYVLIVGVDPQQAFGGEAPLLPLEFAGGNAAAGIDALSRPGACLVPPAFAKHFGLAVGDPVPLRTPAGATRTEPLVVGGIASLPGWHWVTKFSRMRTLGGKPLAPLVIDRATATALGIGRIRHWYIDQAPDYDRADLRAALEQLANAHAGEYIDAHFGPGMARGVSVKVIDTIDVRDRMKTRADSVIWVLGALPLTALLVAILGVANAIAAGVRVRTWEFGVLRSVGLEAGTARRLVLGEALLLALAAAVLSVPAGILTARAGIILGVQAYNTGTALPGMVIPWLDIVIAVLVTTVVALLAALLPARRLARHQPLELLQQGRAAG